ncbi:efflux RND transporter periplasmic adaptor subunit [Rubellicoccus peritrichatus]|uniref:Efflux RND transporter periplasmic adaptor subunit n=1 Tax=Rubellicoccus peritrichatus TaxID=3080537 RepID=A0AAQ3LCQ0_9BACT|nr:efflux RND transporter periplasmic adaptor subunit [Puniceicoccus sp. CR14]WOO42972.1 efflux RND transporter periplasmic adaptor subunit [Puniceicoccus sp. CR14]
MTNKSHLSVLCIFSFLSAQVGFAANRADNTIILDDNGIKNLRIESVEVEEQVFETTLFAIGRIEQIPENHSVLSTRIAGRVVELEAFEGDTVKKGQVLAKVESRQLGNPPPTVTLTAPQDGLVISSHVQLGQPVEPEAEMMDISDRSQMWAVAQIPEKEASQIGIGTKARIHVQALGDETIMATLTRFGVDADRQAGTIEGIFQVANPDGKLRPGMRAEFSIIIATRGDILAVPEDSIQGDPSQRVVFVRDFDLANGFVRVPVVVGEQNDESVEILSGLFPGDEVVTRGSYLLSFTGGGSSMSLKEALDAAHGHEHNEDGSEMTDEQREANRKAKLAAQGMLPEPEAKTNMPLLIYAAVMTCLFLVVLQRLLAKRHTRKGEENA